MKVVTRTAPGASGPLHLGSLYNILLNYIFAKKHNGTFFLRLDAPHKTGPTNRFEREIEETLQMFGLVPDFVVKQTERSDIYKKQLKSLFGHPDIYFCNCNNQDITKRLSKGSKGFCIERYDKYPSPCIIKQIKVFDKGRNIIGDATVTASVSAPGGFRSENIVLESGIWKPFNSWYYGKAKPVVTIIWQKKVLMNSVEIDWSLYPAKTLQIWIDSWKVAELERENSYRQSLPQINDVLNFEPTEGRVLTIMPTEFMKVVQKEYCYDQHCRDRKLSLEMNDSGTFVRKQCDNFVDVILWNGEERKVDLAFRSAIDDREFGTTHSIRGVDIDVFAKLERQCGELIDYEPNNMFHSLVLHPNMYKYAKSTGAKDVMWYISQGLDPNFILSCLVWKMGLIPKKERMNLEELVEAVQFPTSQKHVVINENEFVKECLL